jgi:hypothetical protein
MRVVRGKSVDDVDVDALAAAYAAYPDTLVRMLHTQIVRRPVDLQRW